MPEQWTLVKSEPDPAGDVGAQAALRVLATQTPGPGEKFPGGLPPELAAMAEPPPLPTTRKAMEEAAPTAAALIGTALIPQARITRFALPALARMGITIPALQKILLGMGRVSEAAAIGGLTQAGVEGERKLTGSAEAPKSIDDFFSNVSGAALKQAGYQGVGELFGAPVAKAGQRLGAEDEIASKLLTRSVTRHELFDWVQAHGIQMTPGEATGGGLAKLLQHIAETSIVGIGPAQESANLSHKAANDLITEIRTILGAGGLTNQEVGKLLKTNLGGVLTAIEGPGGFFDKAYTDFGTRANVKVNLAAAKQNLRQYYNDLGDLARAQPALAEEIAPALKRGQQFIKGQDELDPLLAHRIRSKFWQLARTTENNEVRSIVAKMGQEVDKAIVEAADAAEPRLGKAWRGINFLYSDWNKTLSEANVSRLKKTKTEDVGRFLYNAGQTPTHALQKIFSTWGNDPESIQAMRDGFFNQFFQDADATGIVSERKIMTTLMKVGPERLNMVLGSDKAGREAFSNLVMLGRAEGMMPRLFNPSFSGASVRAEWDMRKIIEGLAFGAMGGHFLGIGAAAGAGAAGAVEGAVVGVKYVMSRVMFSRGATNALVKAMAGAATGNTQVYISNLARMYEMIQDTEEIGTRMGDFVRTTLAGKPTPTATVLPGPVTTPTPTQIPATATSGGWTMVR